jgi:2-succinyl-5-enolpyruvyl-6-hydroxy-3-cyclohexene-1-carboxylate synthase
LAPALSEALYQEIPLLALTADRPAEWIDQWDGQTIRQTNFLSTCVKNSLEFPNATADPLKLDWFQQRIANEAILCLTDQKNGPVHLNIPIAEPFYPTKGEELELPKELNKIQIAELESTDEAKVWQFLEKHYLKEQKIVLSIGQIEDCKEFHPYLKRLQEHGVLLLGDSTANASEFVIQNHDLILSNDKIWNKLYPELVIHIGKSHVSKRIKQFFRSQKDLKNWLIRKVDKSAIIDNYQSLTAILNVNTIDFLRIFETFIANKLNTRQFITKWDEISKIISERQHSYLLNNTNWNELGAIGKVLKHLEQAKQPVHLGNSLSIRYSNWVPFFPNANVYCNRGTSGIDGTVSTFIAASCKNQELSYLLLGDLSFQYDKNGLWNAYSTKNQRIIIINNAGGGIFRNLEGAKDLPELESYIATKQINTAEQTAIASGFNYVRADDYESLKIGLKQLAQPSEQGIILEIFTDPVENKNILSEYMGLFKS